MDDETDRRIFAVFDAEGRARGFFLASRHGLPGAEEAITPASAVEITPEQHRELLESRDTRKWNATAGRLEIVTPPPPRPTETPQERILRNLTGDGALAAVVRYIAGKEGRPVARILADIAAVEAAERGVAP